MVSSVADKAYVTNGPAGGDVKATNDVDGSNLFGGAGDDTLRGGKYDDVLNGGAGDDTYFGGDGADQFRFYGNAIEGTSDTDKVFDLDFNEGDTFVFAYYAGSNFHTSAGLSVAPGVEGATASSWAGLASALSQLGATIVEKGNTDVAIVSFDVGGKTQIIHITGGYDALTTI